jgi:hypothetical protein
MKYRKDIHDYLISLQDNDKYYYKKDYKFFEQDGLLYRAEYDQENKNKIKSYGSYYDLFLNNKLELLNKIEQKFNLTFANDDCDIICRCGASNQFSAYVPGYELVLKCNNCGYEFTAYSG